MSWPPQIGDLLPNGDRAWAEGRKWRWILSAQGHGTEWSHVLHVGPDEVDRIWEAIVYRAGRDVISGVRWNAELGVTCSVEMTLTFGSRMANVRTVWHYANPGGLPRLVTAYPNL